MAFKFIAFGKDANAFVGNEGWPNAPPEKLFTLGGDCRDRLAEGFGAEESFISFRLLSISDAVRSLGVCVERGFAAGTGVMVGSVWRRCCSSYCFVRLRMGQEYIAIRTSNTDTTRARLKTHFCFSRKFSGLVVFFSGVLMANRSCRSSLCFEVDVFESTPFDRFVDVNSKLLLINERVRE